MINFKNTYSKLADSFFKKAIPAEFENPKLIQFNRELALELGMNFSDVSSDDLALIFSGQKILPGSEPIAMAYAAHQFGHFVPLLGDGRAHLLGEVNGYDLQLKGSGQTAYSRRGDGRSALGPVIREYLVSEAMFHLGVPSTRALCAVTTGENVYRKGPEPGGVFTRVSPSHLRVGTFQYFSFKNDLQGLEELLNYSISRHYPALSSIENISMKAIGFIQAVAEAQAKLVAKWMSLGFIHGVMNTDNFSIGGFTIDFGPCAFMDEYKEDKVFSSIDRNGRYAYRNQGAIAQWNLMRLADCLLPFVDTDQAKAISKVEETIPSIALKFEHEYLKSMASKFGIRDALAADRVMIANFLNYLEEEALDFTLAFRNLPDLYSGLTDFYPHTSKLEEFIKYWKKRVGIKEVSILNSINPLLIPRNHLIEEAIELANIGEYKLFHELDTAWKTPFFAVNSKYALPPKQNERVTHTFCGT